MSNYIARIFQLIGIAYLLFVTSDASAAMQGETIPSRWSVHEWTPLKASHFEARYPTLAWQRLGYDPTAREALISDIKPRVAGPSCYPRERRSSNGIDRGMWTFLAAAGIIFQTKIAAKKRKFKQQHPFADDSEFKVSFCARLFWIAISLLLAALVCFLITGVAVSLTPAAPKNYELQGP